MLLGEKGARCLHLFPHRCRQIRRVKINEIYENQKNAKVEIGKYDFDTKLYFYVNSITKIINSALWTKQWKNKGQMESILVKIAKIALLTQKSLFEPKITF